MFDETTDAYCEDHANHALHTRWVEKKIYAEFLKAEANGTYNYHWALKDN